MSAGSILNADMATVGASIAKGYKWWTAQLREMVPDSLLAGGRKRPLVELEAGDDPEGLSAPGGARLSSLALVLPPAYCLLRQVELPAMNDRDLARMAALDADRLMPLGREGTIVAARMLDRGGEGGLARVEVAGLAKDRAVLLCHWLLREGCEPAAIHPAGLHGGAPSEVDLLPALRRAGLWPDHSRSAAKWWLAVAALFALNLGIMVWRDVAAVGELEALVESQQPSMNVARSMRTRIARTGSVASQTGAQRQSREPLAQLTAIAAALPDGAWLKSYAWQGDTLRLSGFRPPRADITGALRQAGFARVRYAGVAASAGTPLGQPFELTAEVGSD